MSASRRAHIANLDQLIDRQMALSDVRRKLAQAGGEEARRELAHLKEGPWITLSRHRGTDGDLLAQKVAEKLGWQVFDREIVQAIASQDPVREKLLSRLDEHAADALQDFLGTVLVREAVSRNKYAHDLAKIVWALARHGRVVLVGRGANWLLDPRHGLRVRTVASREFRIKRISVQRKVDPILAGKQLLQEDEDMAAFIRQMYHREIEDPLGYDLILNMETLGTEAAADAVITAMRRKLESTT
jgi:cytidylate kinase